MEKRILFIGLDVDDKNFNAYAIFEDDMNGSAFKTRASAGALLKSMERFKSEDVIFRFCYESTFSGYHLCRSLRAAGHECEIIAAGLIPELSSDRVKNDRLDAEKLARLFMKGMLTNIHIPDLDDEIDRTMVRSRSYLAGQLRSLKRHIIAVIKQIGWNYRENNEKSVYWTEKHREWIRGRMLEAPESVKTNLKILLSQLDTLESHIEDYDQKITQISKSEKYSKNVSTLVCFRGIDTLSAMSLLTELGDIKRFKHPKQIVSYAGMDIAEYSSGGKERRYSMTKMGNRHLRTTLIESAQPAPRPPLVSKALKKRREGSSLEQRSIADRCMKRLHMKAKNMIFRSKPVNKIKSACARELIGFVWEALSTEF